MGPPFPAYRWKDFHIHKKSPIAGARGEKRMKYFQLYGRKGSRQIRLLFPSLKQLRFEFKLTLAILTLGILILFVFA
jgi:hypothetical protein